MPITPELCHAARILTRIDISVLARRSGVAEDTIADFEDDIGTLDHKALAALQSALENFGAVFLSEGDGGGIGVRLKFTKSESRRIEGWEAEGGTAADDEVL